MSPKSFCNKFSYSEVLGRKGLYSVDLSIPKESFDGIILNAGGYTHTSVAIRDCIAAIETPVVEVHISNIAGRESFRHESKISPVCVGCVFGFGLKSYELAVRYFLMVED
jgi:3-dehydroquinate dehydratase II